MENHIYRSELTFEKTLEFYICNTNEINPTRDIKEIGIVVYDGKKLQLDGSLDESELDSLINFLQDARRYINDFNRESKPKEE